MDGFCPYGIIIMKVTGQILLEESNEPNRKKQKEYMPLTSNSSSPIRIRPSVAAGPSGLIPTTNMLMRDLSLLPARLSPSPFLSFSSSIMCNSPGRSAYLCLIFSIKKKKVKKI